MSRLRQVGLPWRPDKADSAGRFALRTGSGAQVLRQGSITLAILITCCTAWAPDAAAQDDVLVGHIELSGGAGIFGGAALGTRDADLRTTTANQPFRLFTASSRMAMGPLFDARLGVALSPRYAVEAHLGYGRPELRTELSSDAEGAPSITAVESVDQYVIDGGLVLHLGRLGSGVRPFVTAGAGYLRQLHEGQVVVEDGTVFYAGGGLKYGLISRSQGLVKIVGLRGDARLNVLSGGIHVDDRVRRHVAVSGGVFVVF